MKFRIDALSFRDATLTVEGWAIGENGKKVEFSVTDLHGHPVECTAVERDRADVMLQFGTDLMCGFTVTAPFERGMDVYFILKDGPVRRRVRVNEKIIARKNSSRGKRSEKLLALCHAETLQVAWDFYRENGFRALLKKSVHKIQKIDGDYDYAEWEVKTRLTGEEIADQRESWKSFEQKPLISVVIPAYNTGEEYLRMLYDSLKDQTYPKLEILVADGSDKGNSVRKVTEEYRRAAETALRGNYASGNTAGTGECAGDSECNGSNPVPVFRYLDIGGNLGIAGNTNAGLKAATGDWIALCDHDDELPLSAFYAVVKAINENPGARFVYTDEDKVDFDGKAVFEPHFKSDYNPELLTSVNYICHLSVIRKDLLEKTGGFRSEFDGAQDYDFFLRCTEEAVKEESGKLDRYRSALAAYRREKTSGSGKDGTDSDIPATPEICGKFAAETGFTAEEIRALLEGRFTSGTVIHVPEICYHWRYHKGSTAENPQSKLYAFEAGARAVKARYDRLGIPYREVEKGVTYGFYHTVPVPCDDVKVSVIIPNKDHVEDLDKCIRSIVRNSVHRNIEFVIVENNSTNDETFDYYRKIDGNIAFFCEEKTEAAEKPAGEYSLQADSAESLQKDISPMSIRVVRWEREFNYSAINNFGAGFVTGDMILLLNNDIEIIAPGALTEMAALCRREGVGAVGAKLLYGDDTIQHAGVIVGMGGIAGAAFVGLHNKENSYVHRAACVQDYSAVTAACLMMPKHVFEETGGLREELAVAFNDIDLCMKIRSLGYRVVYDPWSVWHHYESKSRGLEDTPEKVMRFNGEIAVFASHWNGILEKGDPYYNRNLTLRKANFALKDLKEEKIGEPFRLELDVEEQLRIVSREKARRGMR